MEENRRIDPQMVRIDADEEKRIEELIRRWSGLTQMKRRGSGSRRDEIDPQMVRIDADEEKRKHARSHGPPWECRLGRSRVLLAGPVG
jgi:hypothetical protein